MVLSFCKPHAKSNLQFTNDGRDKPLMIPRRDMAPSWLYNCMVCSRVGVLLAGIIKFAIIRLMLRIVPFWCTMMV